MAPAKPGWRDEQSEEAIEAKQGVDTRGADDAIVAPLRKRSLTGALYERDSKTNALISGLAALPRDKLTARAAIRKRADPGYIPSECLVYPHPTWYPRHY